MKKLAKILLVLMIALTLTSIPAQLKAEEPFTYHAVKKALPSIVDVKAIRKTSTTIGAGVIADPSGIIIANVHTVRGADSINITLHNKDEISARIIKLIPENDIAILKIVPAGPLSPVKFADPVIATRGTDVFTVGHSRFLNGVVIKGKVMGSISKTDAKTKKRLPGYFIKTRFDANAYKGDSGSPVFDKDGSFMGIIFARSEDNSYDSLVIPADTIMRDYLEVKKPIKAKI
ncbi:MAG: serine protease [Candidatus Omnitrophota bacterium]